MSGDILLAWSGKLSSNTFPSTFGGLHSVTSWIYVLDQRELWHFIIGNNVNVLICWSMCFFFYMSVFKYLQIILILALLFFHCILFRYINAVQSCGLATRLKSRLDSSRDSTRHVLVTRDGCASQPLYDSDLTRNSDIMIRDSTRDSTRMTRRVCIILKFIVVLRSAADDRHIEIWK